jgi:hypothetical protein
MDCFIFPSILLYLLLRLWAFHFRSILLILYSLHFTYLLILCYFTSLTRYGQHFLFQKMIFYLSIIFAHYIFYFTLISYLRLWLNFLQFLFSFIFKSQHCVAAILRLKNQPNDCLKHCKTHYDNIYLLVCYLKLTIFYGLTLIKTHPQLYYWLSSFLFFQLAKWLSTNSKKLNS